MGFFLLEGHLKDPMLERSRELTLLVTLMIYFLLSIGFEMNLTIVNRTF